jgi:ferritin-like metal-binding protein YciE
MSDTLVQHLREARAIEAGLIPTLKVHIATTPPGEHRERLEQHLDETRAHEQALARRLEELGHGGEDPLRQVLSRISAPVGLGLGLARGAARAMLALIGLPLSLFREAGALDADRVLRNVRADAASEALEVATYTAVERLAAASGDQTTARLAAEIRASEERMLEYLRAVVVELADDLAGGPPATGRPGEREPEPQRIPVRERGDGAQARAPGSQPPTPSEPPAPAHVSEEPELVAEVAEPGAEQPAGPELEVDEPWEGYDRMKAREIERRLEDASDELAAVVRLYEAGGKNRQTVIRAAQRRLRVP